jgi:hypothetical protein
MGWRPIWIIWSDVAAAQTTLHSCLGQDGRKASLQSSSENKENVRGAGQFQIN